MNKIKYKFDIFTYLGLILLFLEILNILIHYSNWEVFRELFWFCNIVSLIASFSLIFRNRLLLSSIFIASIPAQFLWIMDFFLQIFGFGLGRTEWILHSDFLIFLISTLLHGLLIPFIFYFLYKKGFDKRSLFLSIFLFAILLLASTYIFTDINENKNCVFYPCDMKYSDTIYLINPEFGTLTYLFNEMFYWSTLISIFYFFSYFYFKKTKKLF